MRLRVQGEFRTSTVFKRALVLASVRTINRGNYMSLSGIFATK